MTEFIYLNNDGWYVRYDVEYSPYYPITHPACVHIGPFVSREEAEAFFASHTVQLSQRATT